VSRCRLAGFLALVLAVAAGPARATEVRDMVGRRVLAPDAPRRVVSLAPSLTEIAFAVGAGEQVVGVTDYCDYPAEATRKSRVGGIYTPNFEMILSLRPDLVLATTEGNREEHIQGLERLGLPVYVVRPTDFASVLESIVRVGHLLGREAAAQGVVAAMRHEADGIARAVEALPRPRVLYVLWGNPLIVPGRATLITDLIRRAGGDSVTGQEPLPYPRFSVEEAVARRPERIVLALHGESTVDQRLREWEQLTLLPAVREGRIAPVDGNLLHRPGPRVVEGLRALARAIHPEVPW
jgi:iron complex transport system substrate-binding protein